MTDVQSQIEADLGGSEHVVQTCAESCDGVPDEMHLLKIVFTPEDVINGVVHPVAFDIQDLKTPSRCVSVDRRDKIVPSQVQMVAENQIVKAKSSSSPPKQKDDPFGTWLLCGSIRDVTTDIDGVNVKPLNVACDRLPENPAHCAIANARGLTSKSYRLQLQTKLAALTFNTAPLSAILGGL